MWRLTCAPLPYPSDLTATRQVEALVRVTSARAGQLEEAGLFGSHCRRWTQKRADNVDERCHNEHGNRPGCPMHAFAERPVAEQCGHGERDADDRHAPGPQRFGTRDGNARHIREHEYDEDLPVVDGEGEVPRSARSSLSFQREPLKSFTRTCGASAVDRATSLLLEPYAIRWMRLLGKGPTRTTSAALSPMPRARNRRTRGSREGQQPPKRLSPL